MKEKLFALLQTLGFGEKAKTGDYSAEELKQIDAECKEKLNMSFVEAIALAAKDNEKVVALEESHKESLKLLFGENKEVNPEAKNLDVNEGIKGLQEKNQNLEAQLKKMGEEKESTEVKKMQTKLNIVPVTGGAHTAKYLFGIEAPLFAREKPWNAVAAARQPLEVIASQLGFDPDWRNHKEALMTEVRDYGVKLANRISQLMAEGKLSNISMQSIDFTGFDSTGWGEDYIVRRQDTLIAFIRNLNKVTKIFNVRYGVQNKEELTNSFLTNFSAAFQTGHYFKGKTSVQPIVAQVFDVMLKHKFSDLKALEKEYIGYLNREGSDPMKWTWVEWVIARILEVATNEQEERRVLGRRIEPTAGTLGHHLHGSNGILETLWAWAREFRLLPFTSYTYTSSTILTTAKSFVESVYSKLPSLAGLTLYINEKHIPWYTANFRAAYGAQFDFSGAKLAVMDYPDVKIVGIPNMGNSCMMILTASGNIEFVENLPGEMAKMYMQRDLEELITASYWKEGVVAYMVGKKFADAATLTADDYQNQYIFFTDDTITLAADATTVDGTKGIRFKSVANSAAPTITDITSAKPGVVYRITCESATNASKTAKSGKFSLVNAWVPTAVGDYLEVYLYQNLDNDSDTSNGKFVEVARKVTA
jgi:hypothetical protein